MVGQALPPANRSAWIKSWQAKESACPTKPAGLAKTDGLSYLGLLPW